DQRFEQAPANDLETFLGTRRPPRGFHATDRIAEPIQCLAPTAPANLDVISLGVWRSRSVRCRQTDDQKTVLRQLCRLRQRLSKGEMSLEAAGREIALVMQLTRIGDPLVDQDERRSVLVEQIAQDITGARRLLVVRPNAVVGRSAAKLPSELAPQRVNESAVFLLNRVAGRDLVPDQNNPPDRGKLSDSGLLHDTLDAEQFAWGRTGEQMVQCQHRVRLAATEVGLELDHRVAAVRR